MSNDTKKMLLATAVWMCYIYQSREHAWLTLMKAHVGEWVEAGLCSNSTSKVFSSTAHLQNNGFSKRHTKQVQGLNGSWSCSHKGLQSWEKITERMSNYCARWSLLGCLDIILNKKLLRLLRHEPWQWLITEDHRGIRLIPTAGFSLAVFPNKVFLSTLTFNSL